jgi:hypothetical protein
LATIKEKRTLDNAKKTFAYTTNLEDWRRFIAAINELCLIVKRQPTAHFSTFGFARHDSQPFAKPKELKFSHRTQTVNKLTTIK